MPLVKLDRVEKMIAIRMTCSLRVYHDPITNENPGNVSDSKKPKRNRQLAKPAKLLQAAIHMEMTPIISGVLLVGMRSPQVTTFSPMTLPV